MVSSGETVEVEQQEQQQQQQEIHTENGNSSDSEHDKIQKLKAENRMNGNHETSNGEAEQHTNGESKENGGVVTLDDDDEEEVLPEHVQKVEEEEAKEEIVASTSTEPSEKAVEVPSENGEKAEKPATNGTKREVECIDLDDDDEEEVSKEPPAKKSKVEEEKKEEKVEEVKKESVESADTSSAERLLDQLENYVMTAIETKNTINRKILDALLGAINLQVQREPLSVRKLILDKQLVLPNTISFPPSQTVDMLIEHDPDFPISKVINKMFGEEKPKLSETERKERAVLKANNPVPHMTKLLMDIGQDLVQESTYCDIVHAKNLPETPKNVDTYKQVAQQLKPVWETLKRKNEPFKLKMKRCLLCGFQTESSMVMSAHKATVHMVNNKYHCALCKDYDSSEQRIKEHYLEAHLIIAKSEEKESKYPCLICEEDFNFKGVREQHFKQCKKDYIRVRHIMAPKQDDFLHINRWLWEKPPIDPTILAQQQQAQEQQLKKQRLQQAQQLQALQRKQQLAQQQQQQQQLLKQQQQVQLRQMAQLMQAQVRGSGNILNNNSLIAAMQSQFRQRNSAASTTLAATLLQKQFAQQAAKTPGGAAAIQAAAAAALRNHKTPKASSSPSQAKQAAAIIAASSNNSPSSSSSLISSVISVQQCEICDQNVTDKEKYLYHLQGVHKQMVGKTVQDMSQGAPLACSRCRDRFWTYEGLERHLVMSHGLVTADLLQKAQKKEDGGRCKLCGKQYAFNMLTHLVADHQVKLCSAEIMYSCDVCSFKCTSYQTLESHLSTNHPKGSAPAAAAAEKTQKADCITLDD